MINKVINILKYVGWIHEIFHWIPAKLFGSEVVAHSDHVDFTLLDDDWKNVVITVSPLIVSLTVFGLILYAVRQGLDSGWLWPAGFYLASSFWDLVDLVVFVKTGDWPDGAKTWLQTRWRTPIKNENKKTSK